ncbi:tail fiber assembly protein [Shigella flexneri]|nr:tail fiber assembly protein [Shigella flexneri]
MNKPQLAESQKTALLTEAESVIRPPGRAVRLNRETDESGEAGGGPLFFRSQSGLWFMRCDYEWCSCEPFSDNRRASTSSVS